MTTSEEIQKNKPHYQPSADETMPCGETGNVQSPWLERNKEAMTRDVSPSAPTPEVVQVPDEDTKEKKTSWKAALLAELMIQAAKLVIPEASGAHGTQYDTAISQTAPATQHTTQRQYVQNVPTGSGATNEGATEEERFWKAMGPVIDAIAKKQPDASESEIQEPKAYVKKAAEGAGAEVKDADKVGHIVGHTSLEEGVKYAIEGSIALAAWGARKLKKAGRILSKSGELLEQAERLLKDDPALPASKIAEKLGCSEEIAEALKNLHEELLKDSTPSAKAARPE